MFLFFYSIFLLFYSIFYCFIIQKLWNVGPGRFDRSVCKLLGIEGHWPPSHVLVVQTDIVILTQHGRAPPHRVTLFRGEATHCSSGAALDGKGRLSQPGGDKAQARRPLHERQQRHLLYSPSHAVWLYSGPWRHSDTVQLRSQESYPLGLWCQRMVAFVGYDRHHSTWPHSI